MRKLFILATMVGLSPTTLHAQQNCGHPHSCTAPGCTESCTAPALAPTPAQITAQGDQGAFAAPPRTGTAVGETRSLGIEGLGIHLPATTLRLPTLQLPGLVRYRREPRMMIDAAEAGFVRNTMTNISVPAGNQGLAGITGANGVNANGTNANGTNANGDPSNTNGLGDPSGPPAPPCTRPTNANGSCTQPGAARAGGIPHGFTTDESGANGSVPPPPPVPQLQPNGHVNPGFGASFQQPSQRQVIRDPATGQMYQVIVQPVSATYQQQSQYIPVQMPNGQQAYLVAAQPAMQPMYVQQPMPAPVAYAAPQQVMQVAAAMEPVVMPQAAPMMYPVPQTAAVAPVQQVQNIVPLPGVGSESATSPDATSAREVQLTAALQESQQRAEQIESQVRRLEQLVDQMAQSQQMAAAAARSQAAIPAPPLPTQVPVQEVSSGAINLQQPSSGAPGVVGAVKGWFSK